jgi:hypothetical protein
MHCHHAGRDALANERGGAVVQLLLIFCKLTMLFSPKIVKTATASLMVR